MWARTHGQENSNEPTKLRWGRTNLKGHMNKHTKSLAPLYICTPQLGSTCKFGQRKAIFYPLYGMKLS